MKSSGRYKKCLYSNSYIKAKRPDRVRFGLTGSRAFPGGTASPGPDRTGSSSGMARPRLHRPMGGRGRAEAGRMAGPLFLLGAGRQGRIFPPFAIGPLFGGRAVKAVALGRIDPGADRRRGRQQPAVAVVAGFPLAPGQAGVVAIGAAGRSGPQDLAQLGPGRRKLRRGSGPSRGLAGTGRNARRGRGGRGGRPGRREQAGDMPGRRFRRPGRRPAGARRRPGAGGGRVMKIGVSGETGRSLRPGVDRPITAKRQTWTSPDSAAAQASRRRPRRALPACVTAPPACPAAAEL